MTFEHQKRSVKQQIEDFMEIHKISNEVSMQIVRKMIEKHKETLDILKDK